MTVQTFFTEGLNSFRSCFIHEIRARSSARKSLNGAYSIGLLTRGSGVQFPPGPPSTVRICTVVSFRMMSLRVLLRIWSWLFSLFSRPMYIVASCVKASLVRIFSGLSPQALIISLSFDFVDFSFRFYG